MARIPILNSPGPLQTGNQTLQTAQLPAVTNASIGKALGDVSSVAFDISKKAKRANDVTHLTNASLEMQKAQLEFATFQQGEADESKWLPKWQELTTKIEGNVSKMPLTPDARAQLTDRFSKWSTNGTIAVQAEGFKQAGVRMEAVGQSARQAAIDSGDMSIYDDHLKGEVSANLKLPEVAKLELDGAVRESKQKKIADLKAQVPLLVQSAKDGNKSAIDGLADVNDQLLGLGDKSVKESSLYNDVIIKGIRSQQEVDDQLVIANDDPDRAMELAVEAEKQGKITGKDRVNIEREAHQSKAFKRRDSVTKYKERIALHDIPTFEELKSDTNLTDFDRYAIVALAGGDLNDPSEFESALTAAMTFDSGAYVDPREAVTVATQMEASFEARFDGPYLDNLRAELAKRRDRDPAQTTAETDIGPAMQQVEDSIRSGGLFPLDRPVMQDGKPVMQDAKKLGFVVKPGWIWDSQKDVKKNDGKPVALTEVDRVAVEKAAAIQREIRRTLESEVKAGKLKDQSEITARMYDLATMKGIKVKPVKPNAMIPALNSDGLSVEAYNETLKKYGK